MLLFLRSRPVKMTGAELVDLKRVEPLDEVVHFLGLGEKGFELVEGEGTGSVALGAGGFGVRLEE